MGMALFLYLGMVLASQTGCGIFLGLVVVLEYGLWHHRQIENCSQVWYLYISLVFGITGRCGSHFGYDICTSVCFFVFSSKACIEVLSMVFDITDRLRGILGSVICTWV